MLWLGILTLSKNSAARNATAVFLVLYNLAPLILDRALSPNYNPVWAFTLCGIISAYTAAYLAEKANLALIGAYSIISMTFFALALEQIVTESRTIYHIYYHLMYGLEFLVVALSMGRRFELVRIIGFSSGMVKRPTRDMEGTS